MGQFFKKLLFIINMFEIGRVNMNAVHSRTFTHFSRVETRLDTTFFKRTTHENSLRNVYSVLIFHNKS